ncbi:hypothetical protein CSUI_006737 [Cystoisospora suis]|uniref:Secreted protein n=1 Tax=Cystoisospora suis TaxID=483139 RepID=A0A2C6KSZ5_9APIC|nr:hypothetical protein CSUI_006737 [Cystoisospora suis]
MRGHRQSASISRVVLLLQAVVAKELVPLKRGRAPSLLAAPKQSPHTYQRSIHVCAHWGQLSTPVTVCPAPSLSVPHPATLLSAGGAVE